MNNLFSEAKSPCRPRHINEPADRLRTPHWGPGAATSKLLLFRIISLSKAAATQVRSPIDANHYNSPSLQRKKAPKPPCHLPAAGPAAILAFTPQQRHRPWSGCQPSWVQAGTPAVPTQARV
jgi:hypothetical protein